MEWREVVLLVIGAGLGMAAVLGTLLYVGVVRRLTRLERFRGRALDFFYELIKVQGGEYRQPLRDHVRGMAEEGDRKVSSTGLTDWAE